MQLYRGNNYNQLDCISNVKVKSIPSDRIKTPAQRKGGIVRYAKAMTISKRRDHPIQKNSNLKSGKR